MDFISVVKCAHPPAPPRRQQANHVSGTEIVVRMLAVLKYQDLGFKSRVKILFV